LARNEKVRCDQQHLHFSPTFLKFARTEQGKTGAIFRYTQTRQINFMFILLHVGAEAEFGGESLRPATCHDDIGDVTPGNIIMTSVVNMLNK
jgi:hypothetical protein